MPRQIINTGGAGNDGTGDTLRTTAEKVNDNFEELYRLSANGGLRVELYKAFNDPTLPESEDISLPTIYDFSGNDITMPEDPTLQGWKLSIPTEGRYVFLIQTSVPKADGVSQKTILPEEWTAPALIYDRGYEDLNVAITAVNGTVFLNDSGETELQARISINGLGIDENQYGDYGYQWTSGGKSVCINKTTRYVSHIDGTIVTVGDDGTCPIGFGIPAESTAQEFSNGELKSIFIEAKAVPNSGTLPIQLTINDKEEG
jgi:hypothetical protein